MARDRHDETAVRAPLPNVSSAGASRKHLALVGLLVGDADDLAVEIARQGECVLVIGVAACVASEPDGRLLSGAALWIDVLVE